MRTATALLAASVLLVPALAQANKHYHVSVCNSTAESVQVSYRVVKGMDQIGDVHPQGITHHGGGDKLESNKCAKLSFVVKYEGMLSAATLVDLVFHVQGGSIEVAFSGVRHESLPGKVRNPTRMTLSTYGSGEHLRIRVDKH